MGLNEKGYRIVAAGPTGIVEHHSTAAADPCTATERIVPTSV